MQLGVGRLDIMHVVGGQVTGRIARAQFYQAAVQVGYFLDIMVLEFDEETLWAKDIVIEIHAPHGFLGVFF